MEYRCLRDCFTYNYLHYKGRTYDIPDGTEVSPKNFQPLEALLIAKGQSEQIEAVEPIAKAEKASKPTRKRKNKSARK